MTTGRSGKHATYENAEALMREDATRPPPPDKLEKLRDAARRLRDLEAGARDAKERLTDLNKQINAMEYSELPGLLMEAGVNSVGLPPEGNMPGYEARLAPYYSARIGAKWDEERQERAFALMEKLGWADLIKSVFEIQLGRGESKTAQAVRAALRKLKVEFSEGRGVPWNTLTAAVKERYRKGKPLSDADLETLGATVGTFVTLTEQRRD